MNRSWKRNAIRALSVLVIAIWISPPVLGDPPSIFSMFRKKQPIDDASLVLKQEHGPWLILAATLSGPDASNKSSALAKEIRTSLNLPAFVMEKKIGGPQTLATRERIKTDSYGRSVEAEVKIKYANGSASSAYAVLVGEFSSTKDPRIEETLTRIRTAQPAALLGKNTPENSSLAEGDNSNWMVQKYRSFMWRRTDNEENLKKGPMGAAFVTRNPMLPDDFFQSPKLDQFETRLNESVEYSLLECPGRFTVRVASFQGKDVTDFGNKPLLNKTTETTDSLDKAAWKAHKLTTALRNKNVEAYEFHDRFGSYVTIGSFDTLGRQTTASEFTYTPGIVAILQEYCGYRIIDTKDPATGAMSKNMSLKSMDKIPFDIEGKPMAVPRPETNELYNGSLLGGG